MLSRLCVWQRAACYKAGKSVVATAWTGRSSATTSTSRRIPSCGNCWMTSASESSSPTLSPSTIDAARHVYSTRLFYNDYYAASHALRKMRPVTIDVARSVVCASVCLVCMLITRRYCAKRAEPIEIALGRLTLMDPKSHVLDGDKDPLPFGPMFWVIRSIEKIGSLCCGACSKNDHLSLNNDCCSRLQCSRLIGVLKCSLDIKRSFYRAANAVFAKIGRVASEEVTPINKKQMSTSIIIWPWSVSFNQARSTVPRLRAA